jgi:hypothetical protein
LSVFWLPEARRRGRWEEFSRPVLLNLLPLETLMPQPRRVIRFPKNGLPPVRPLQGRDKLRITRLETFAVKPRWLFLKVHTDEGIVGWGEPIVEGRAETCAAAVAELAKYLVGQDPRQVVHHWQAMYRHAFYRGGPVLTSAISGIDMALWDIKGKALGVPVYELLGGPTRSRVRVYAHIRNSPDVLRQRQAEALPLSRRVCPI